MYYIIIGIGLAFFTLFQDQALLVSIIRNIGFLFPLTGVIIFYVLSWLLSIAIYQKTGAQ